MLRCDLRFKQGPESRIEYVLIFILERFISKFRCRVRHFSSMYFFFLRRFYLLSPAGLLVDTGMWKWWHIASTGAVAPWCDSHLIEHRRRYWYWRKNSLCTTSKVKVTTIRLEGASGISEHLLSCKPSFSLWWLSSTCFRCHTSLPFTLTSSQAWLWAASTMEATVYSSEHGSQKW